MAFSKARNASGRFFPDRKSYQKVAVSIPGNDNIPYLLDQEVFVMHDHTMKMSPVVSINYKPLRGGSHLLQRLSEIDLLLVIISCLNEVSNNWAASPF
jgi:hypothetical protein